MTRLTCAATVVAVASFEMATSGMAYLAAATG